MSKGKLKIATCQFAVGKSVSRNAAAMIHYIQRAAEQGAEIVHFPEAALSGYAGTDFFTFDGFDWQLLREKTRQIMQAARKCSVWVVLGSVHELTEPNKPYNCLYLIDPAGELVDRYDKRYLTMQEMAFFSAGSRQVFFEVNSVRCSLQICFELRFPEIYRDIYKRGVDCVLQSFYNARQSGPSVHTDIMRQTMQCRAASNKLWVSMTNSSAPYSPYPSCFIRPDGKIAGQLNFNKAGMMVNTVDLDLLYYDPMDEFRDLAIEGRPSNAPEVVYDPRSRDITSL